MPGPLDGYRVVDLTTMVSGPLTTMILADQGADVIKVEAPAGDHTRHVARRRGGFSTSFLNNNRNKRSIVLDLKTPGGVAALKRLAASADVFIQNFRPGAIARLGLDAETLCALNPKLVFVSIAGFGFDGPFAAKPVFDPLIQSLSGLTVQAGSDEARPRLVRTILPDKLTGYACAQAVCAALLARARTGEGQHVRLSMLDAVIAFLWSSDMSGYTFIGDDSEREAQQSFIDLIYETADGHISVAVMRRKEWESLSRAVGRPEWLEDPRFLELRGARHSQGRAAGDDAGGAARPHDRGMDRAPRGRGRALRAGADAARDDPPSAGGGKRADRRDRASARRMAAPGAHASGLLRHAGGASARRAGPRRRHERDPGRGRLLRRGDRGAAREGRGDRGGTMITFFYAPTPNGWKVAIMLEECGLAYETRLLRLGQGDQFAPEFLSINPNAKIPAIVDDDPPAAYGATPISVFESGAILLYLAGKAGRFAPTDPPGRKELMEWLFWQVGNQGPMAGQLSHFHNYAPEGQEYALKRYMGEYERNLAVLENRLEGRDYILSEYSIADMLAFPWAFIAKPLGVSLDASPCVAAWRGRIKERPAVRRAIDLHKDRQNRGELTAENNSLLYNQTAGHLRKDPT